MRHLFERMVCRRSDAIREIFSGLPDKEFSDAFDQFSNPGRKHLRRLSDDDLAALISASPSSKQGILAASIFRERESWRAPARWALIISLMSLILAISAFMRTI